MKTEKDLIDSIKKVLNDYNKKNNTNLSIIDKDDTYDATELFICKFDTNKIGLFKREGYTDETYYSYDTYSIYVGIDSNYKGIFKNGNSQATGYGVSFDYYGSFVASCHIDEVMSYNNVRFQMYKDSNNKPNNIDFKKTTSHEISEVLIYANKILNKENLDQKVKQL